MAQVLGKGETWLFVLPIPNSTFIYERDLFLSSIAFSYMRSQSLMMRIKIPQVLVTPSGKSSSPSPSGIFIQMSSSTLSAGCRWATFIHDIIFRGRECGEEERGREREKERRRGESRGKGKASSQGKEREKDSLGTPSSGSGVQVPVSLSLEVGRLVKVPPLGS